MLLDGFIHFFRVFDKNEENSFLMMLGIYFFQDKKVIGGDNVGIIKIIISRF